MMKIKHNKKVIKLPTKKKFLIEHACCVISKKQTLRNIDFFGKVTEIKVYLRQCLRFAPMNLFGFNVSK